jgi:hypothetical protein
LIDDSQDAAAANKPDEPAHKRMAWWAGAGALCGAVGLGLYDQFGGNGDWNGRSWVMLLTVTAFVAAGMDQMTKADRDYGHRRMSFGAMVLVLVGLIGLNAWSDYQRSVRLRAALTDVTRHCGGTQPETFLTMKPTPACYATVSSLDRTLCRINEPDADCGMSAIIEEAQRRTAP